jgi:putative transposase
LRQQHSPRACDPRQDRQRRRHHLHEQSTRIARQNRLIAVGNVNVTKLATTRMAKSVLDAGWSMFRNQLHYKVSRHGARYVEADER